MLVCKFGGTSLADEGCIRRAADIINSDPRRRCIVVSAPGRTGNNSNKITDLLINASRGDSNALIEINERFFQISSSLGIKSIEKHLKTMGGYISRGRDAAASRGEWLCAKIISEYLDLPFVDAADVIHFSGKNVDIPLTYACLQKRCKSGAVIPGFYGSDLSGNIVTFPRGGSDVTGALAAAALNAETYENWTDVSGIYTADPSLVPAARPVPRMDYSKALMLTMSGASVLHFSAIAPVREKSISILIKNTFAPSDKGTLITASCEENTPCVASRITKNGHVHILAHPVSPAAHERIFALMPPDVRLRMNGEILTAACAPVLMKTAVRLIHSRLHPSQNP